MRARGKVGLYFITGIKETQNGTRAAPTALVSPQHSHSTLERSPRRASRTGCGATWRRRFSSQIHEEL